MKIDTEEFIKRARAVHGDKYDYSSSVYTKAHSKLTIICPEHGPFQQIAKDHYRYGCNKCAVALRGKSRRMTTEQFVDKAVRVHGGRYSYHLVEYKGDNKTPVEIVCTKHGSFWQKPNGHLSGEGCPRCGMASAKQSNAMSFGEFLKRAQERHGIKYDYANVGYINGNAPVTIVCPIHGEFKQRPSHHIRGTGCPKCYYDSMRGVGMTTNDYVAKAVSVHGDKFTYRDTVYKGANEPVAITCGVHGSFICRKAVYHLQGQGCPHCAVHGFNREKPGTVYVLVSDDKTRMKIGLTNYPDRRLSELRRRTPFGFHVAATREFDSGHEAASCEQYLHTLYDNAGLIDFDGATEWFICDFNVCSEVDRYE